MALVLNEEQLMLKDAARGFLNERAPVSHLRSLRDSGSETRYSSELWAEMADMGWPAILVPEEHGGLEYGYTGLGIVLEETGRTLTPSPLMTTALGAVTALRLGGSAGQKEQWLPSIASGEQIMALAVDETSRHQPENIACEAKSDGAGFIINGRKTAVIDGHIAGTLIVAARTDGNPGDADGVTLFLVPANTPGVNIKPYPVLDTHLAANIDFDHAVLDADSVLGTLNGGGPVLHEVLDAIRIGQSAELLGIAQEAFEQTLAYLKERKQFGVPIGSFQALQHRAALMFGELELCKSLVLNALRAQDGEGKNVAEQASMTKAKLCETAHNVCAEAIQMHGGIGMTDDFDIGLFLKRCQVLETSLGNHNYHLDRFSKIRGY
jgi:acyl-CoA dehydrogenase